MRQEPTAYEIGGAQQDMDGVINHLRTALSSAGRVESLIVEKLLQTACDLGRDLERLASAIQEES